MTLKKCFYAFFVLLFFNQNLSAQDLIGRSRLAMKVPAVKLNKKTKSKLEEYQLVEPFTFDNRKNTKSDYGEVTLNFSPRALKKYKNKKKLRLRVPVSTDRYFDLLLEPGRDIIGDSKVYIGDEEYTAIERSQFYRGQVSDDPQSQVSLSISDGHLRMLISDKNGNYNIGPRVGSDEYVLYNDVNLGEFPFECQNDNYQFPVGDIKTKKTIQKNNTNGCVKIYVETDYTTYVNFDEDVQSIVAFVEGAFHEVAMLYDMADIPIQLSDIKIWDTPDPYGADENVGSALSYLSQNIDQFNGDLFHLISATTDCCSWSGVGFVSSGSTPGVFNGTTLCGPNPYAVSQTSFSYETLPSYSWTVNVLAHEMGHNLGSPHTHECAWGPGVDTAIDGCSTPKDCPNPGYPGEGEGTIMSYCHARAGVGISLSNGFHPWVSEHLQSEYQSVGCLISCDPVEGCTDPDDHAYDPLATIEDGSCIGTCDDGIQNGDETGVDCGGELCAPCPFICEHSTFLLVIDMDNYPAETSWDIRDSSGAVILSGGDYEDGIDSVAIDICLVGGDYLFTIYDSYGDGICCNYGDGEYRFLDADGDVLFSGGDFLDESEHAFVVIEAETIIEPTCNDGILNGDETSVDCGGSCGECMPCQDEELMINQDQVINQSEEKIIKNKIVSQAKVNIEDESVVMWQAGESIEINGEFEINVGAEVLLSTESCVDLNE